MKTKITALTGYYTDILGHATTMAWGFALQALYSDEAKVEGAQLIASFTKAEAKKAVRGMNATSTPGPDGLGPSFYATAWDTTKAAVMEFLQAFHIETVDLERINRAMIVLIPKMTPALSPNAFRPVSEDSNKNSHYSFAAAVA
jgi:hypothetical protein